MIDKVFHKVYKNNNLWEEPETWLFQKQDPFYPNLLAVWLMFRFGIQAISFPATLRIPHRFPNKALEANRLLLFNQRHKKKENRSMKIKEGERFIPHWTFHGLFIPYGLAAEPSITPTAKIVWAALLDFSNKDFPRLSDLGTIIGLLDERKLISAITELTKKGLVNINKITNRCEFYEHPCLAFQPLGEVEDGQEEKS
jgi:hypothetical protein